MRAAAVSLPPVQQGIACARRRRAGSFAAARCADRTAPCGLRRTAPRRAAPRCTACSYVLPGEMYASAMRATCHGISAASGKLGAAVGSAAFPIVAQRCGLRVVFALCAAVCALGWLVSEACLPSYDDQVTADLDRAHADDRFLEHLYAPTETRRQSSLVRLWRWMRARGDAGARPDAGCLVVAVLVAVLTIGMGLALAYGRA